MIEFFKKLFDTSDYPARWHCGNWGAFEGWLHIISDSVIFLAYFAIPIVLLFLWKKHKSKIMDDLKWSIILFAAFIMLCGFGHLIDAGVFWHPVYRFLGLVKSLTAIVSTVTAIHLASLIKKLMTLKSKTEWEEKNQELENKNRELEKFAYITSHDLKSPVRAISNITQWIEVKLKDSPDEELHEYLELLVGRSARMTNLIDGILEYSRIGRIELVEKYEDLNDVVESVTKDYPEVKFEIDRLPVYFCNRTRMDQIFSNLIDNSVDHSDKNQVEIKIKYTLMNDVHRFDLIDNGPGIEPKYHEKVFEMFQTLKPKDEHEATGIGLTLVKKIIENKGGKIQIEPCDTGLHIWFVLPIRKGKIEDN